MSTPSDSPSKLAALFSVKPGEGQRTLLMLLYAFCCGTICTFFYTASYALFLAEFSADMLPYVYIGSGVVAAIGGFIYAKLEEKISVSRLMLGTMIVLLISNVVFFAGLRLAGAKWIVFAAIIWYDVLFTFMEVGFWGLATGLYNVREGKRLFGLIGSGEQLAGTIGGLATPLIVVLIGTTNLLLVSLVAFVICLGVLLIILRQNADRLGAGHGAEEAGEDGDEEGAESPGGIRRLLKDRYVALIVLGMVTTLFAFFFLDMAFYDGARARYADEEQLARFLGVFNGVVQGISLFMLPLLSGRLLNRFGLKFGLLLLPVLVGGGTVMLAGCGTVLGIGAVFFWLLVMTKLTDSVVRISVFFPAGQLLYQPLPGTKCTAVQTMVESIVSPVGGALAGAVLVVVSCVDALTSVHVLYALVVVFVAHTLLSSVLAKEYGKALMEALGSRFLKGAGLTLTDASSLDILRTRLSSPHPGEAIYCLDMLENMEHESIGAFLAEALNHPAAEVREHAVGRLQALDLRTELPAILERYHGESSPSVRAAAIQAIFSLAEFEDVEEEAAAVNDPDPLVRKGALVGLIRSGNIEALLTAGERLLELEHSEDPAEREAAAGVLGGVGSSSFYSPLVRLLKDDSVQVRNAALSAAGKVRHARLWPPVFANLASHDCHRAAAAALAQGGDAVVDVLGPAFRAPDQSKALLLRIARICGKIAEPRTTALLKGNIEHTDKDVRLRILQSLALLGYGADSGDRAAATHTIRGEVADAQWALNAQKQLPNAGPATVLKTALGREAAQAAERVFLLLSFLYDSEAIANAQLKLERGTPDEQATALEMLDTLIAQDLKALVLPLLQTTTGTHAAGSGTAHRSGLAELLKNVLTQHDVWISPWTRACALYAAADVTDARLVEAIVPALSDPEPLVRETASWALAALDADAYAKHAPALRDDPAVQVQTIIEAIDSTELGEAKMLLTIEKVLVLKSVSIFSEIPDDVLAIVANALKEVSFKADDVVFNRGDMGSCMYIIVDGSVLIGDAEHTIAELGPREVFGEMAVLDAEPRSATATVGTDTTLLQLGQNVFYELMSDHMPIVRGVSRMLSQRLRGLM